MLKFLVFAAVVVVSGGVFLALNSPNGILPDPGRKCDGSKGEQYDPATGKCEVVGVDVLQDFEMHYQPPGGSQPQCDAGFDGPIANMNFLEGGGVINDGLWGCKKVQKSKKIGITDFRVINNTNVFGNVSCPDGWVATDDMKHEGNCVGQSKACMKVTQDITQEGDYLVADVSAVEGGDCGKLGQYWVNAGDDVRGGCANKGASKYICVKKVPNKMLK